MGGPAERIDTRSSANTRIQMDDDSVRLFVPHEDYCHLLRFDRRRQRGGTPILLEIKTRAFMVKVLS